MKPVVLDMNGISKTFPGVVALNDVCLQVKKGEVHALIGENGAGKSTLMKIILGMYAPDSGELKFKGEIFRPGKPLDALTAGITMIHQEISLADNMTVAENIWIGRLPGSGSIVNYRKMNEDTKALLDDLNIDVNPTTRVGRLSVAQQQMVEIARAISYDADLIIMDEPTSALTEEEVATLFSIICTLRDKGVSVIMITHKLEELFEISDMVTVLRDGCYVGQYPIEEMDEQKLIALMVGRKLDSLYPKLPANIGEPVLKVTGLTRKNVFEDVSFEVRRGEILGVAGLMGAGRSEIMTAVFGGAPVDGGQIAINGENVSIQSPQDSINLGMAMVTEDRKMTGLSLVRSSKENISITNLRNSSPSIFLNQKKELEEVNQMIKALSIKLSGVNQVVKQLSGGNQQKIVLARWLLTNPKILILDEPTRGIDVGAKSEIHRLISELASKGMAVIMISSELPEIMGMSDRILVVHEGRVKGELLRENATQESIMALATNANTVLEEG